jgi:hypothetical protein
VGPRTGLNDMEKRKFLILPGLSCCNFSKSSVLKLLDIFHLFTTKQIFVVSLYVTSRRTHISLGTWVTLFLNIKIQSKI